MFKLQYCTKFGQLIQRKIIKIVALCHILRLKCTKFDFGWGSTPDAAEGAHSAPPDPLTGFVGPTSKGRGRKEGRKGKGKVASWLLGGWTPLPMHSALLAFTRKQVIRTVCRPHLPPT